MIFTRRFGALAARRAFAPISETAQEQILDLPSAETDIEFEQTTIQTAA